jgi:tellurite resistance protein TehA-like permease
MLWGLGLTLSAIYMAQFMYRLFYFDIAPDEMTPVLWVVMGAAAISTNAGSSLVVAGSNQHFLNTLVPFVDGMTLIVWTWATFWAPLLLLIAIWKYAVRRVAPTYTTMLWSAIFPLGMYSVATLRLSRAGDFAALRSIAEAMLWIAVAGWVAAFAALVVASWRSYRAFAVAVPAPQQGPLAV